MKFMTFCFKKKNLFSYFYSMAFQHLKYETLKFFWGYSHFKSPQEDIINSIISGRDTIALLPTGGGKSLCYQLSAILTEGTCIVISPLLALMKDQVAQLQKKGIEAELLSSELEIAEEEEVYSRCKEGVTKLLYISPERLLNRLFLKAIEQIHVSFIAVDEAHCISEWGQDFRPSYQNIRSFRAQFKNVPCIALTATATPRVLQEIQSKLDLKDAAIFYKSFKRENININIDEVADKYQKTADILSYYKGSGIIYVRSRKEAEDLTHFLRSKGLHHVDFYHAKLSPKERNKKQEIWINSEYHILVATNAFGMGIDKNNVRFVIHYSPSSSIENYYQEIGRAGRDGKESMAYLMWNPAELDNFDKILKFSIPNKREFLAVTSYIYSIFQIAEGDVHDKTYPITIERIKKFTKLPFSKIRNILQFLNNQEIIYFKEHKTTSCIELKISSQEIDRLPQRYAYLLELLLRNLSGFTSQKVHFHEMYLAEKIATHPSVLKESLKELSQKGYTDYVDGSSGSIKFLVPRDSKSLEGKYWKLFLQIQKSRVQKWEEMKYYIKERDYCKMKMILTYFGEKKSKNCNKCYICRRQKEKILGKDISQDIARILQQEGAMSLDQIAIRLSFYGKEKILETLMDMLDSRVVKMKDFRTYTLA